MNQLRLLRRTASVVIAVCSSLLGLAVFAPSAFAVRVPPLGDPPPAVTTPPGAITVHSVGAGGMSGWQIALIAVGAALITATVAVLMDRARAARRRPRVAGA
jgi:hypothetical protein